VRVGGWLKSGFLAGFGDGKMQTRRSGVFEDFLDGGGAEVDVAQAVLAQRVHAEFDGFLLDAPRSGRGW
jgi:hypothetical protein